jgi:hypothetical protein
MALSRDISMKHATQARFNKMDFTQVEQRMMVHTIEQMARWTETDWNWHVRGALRAQGFRSFHIREASETGVADLVVYRTYDVIEINGAPLAKGPTQVIEAWLELKVDNDKERYARDDRKASQRQFMREHWQQGHNALFVMFDRKVGMLAVHQGDLKGRVKMCPPYPYAVNWQEVFDSFKARKTMPLRERLHKVSVL